MLHEIFEDVVVRPHGHGQRLDKVLQLAESIIPRGKSWSFALVSKSQKGRMKNPLLYNVRITPMNSS